MVAMRGMNGGGDMGGTKQRGGMMGYEGRGGGEVCLYAQENQIKLR